MSASANIGDLSALADLASGTKPVHVICLGLSALDQVWRVDRPFAGGSEKIKAVEYGTLGGGMAANASLRWQSSAHPSRSGGGQGMMPRAMR